MGRPKGYATTTIRVSQKGKEDYERLMGKYEPHCKSAEFIEIVLESYEKSKMSKKDEK